MGQRCRNSQKLREGLKRAGAPVSRKADRAFTLLEALMACGILLVIVVTVTSAIEAGQQHALDAQRRISGVLAAEELLSRLMLVPYDELSSYDGHTEPPGTMTDVTGQPMPNIFSALGRDVQVTTMLRHFEDLSIKVRGKNITVRAQDAAGRVVAELTSFIPEPQS